MNTQLCSACHGNLTTVGSATRTGWLDVPTCQMCHNNSLRYTSTFTSKGVWRQTKDLTFARLPTHPSRGRASIGTARATARYSVQPATVRRMRNSPLFRPMTMCIHRSCKAMLRRLPSARSAIARFRSAPPAGRMESTPSASPGVNQGGHQSYVEAYGYQACAYCHGLKYNGSVLSQAKIQRVFAVDDGKTKTFPALHQFTCFDCHNGPNGG